MKLIKGIAWGLLAGLMPNVCESASLDSKIERLLPAIRMVESGNNPKVKRGDSGKAIGIYQIHRSYWQDGCEFLGVDWNYESGAKDVEKSTAIVRAYLTRYGRAYERDTKRPASLEVLAKLHNGGAYGYRKKATAAYWAKVSRCL